MRNNLISQIHRLPVATSTFRGWFAFDVIKTVNVTKFTNVNVHATFHDSKNLSDELKAFCDLQLHSWAFFDWEELYTGKACCVLKSFQGSFCCLMVYMNEVYLKNNSLWQVTLWPLYFFQHFCFAYAAILTTLTVEFTSVARNVDYVFVNHLRQPLNS